MYKTFARLTKEEYANYRAAKLGEIRGQLIVRIPQRIRRQLGLKKEDIVEISVSSKDRQIILKVQGHGNKQSEIL